MLARTFKREPLPITLGFVLVAALVSAVPVHPQNTSPSDAASGSAMKSGKVQPSQTQPGQKDQSKKDAAPSSSGTSSTSTSESGSADKSAAADASGKASLSAGDRKLVTDLAQANIAEIATAKLAQDKSKNDEVRNFAQRMIDDHGKALDQVKKLADAKGVQLPAEPDAKHQALAKKLGAMSGDAFDRAYMSQAGTADHRQAHNLVARISTSARDPELKALGKELMPAIDQHMQMVQQMQGGKSASKSTGPSSSGK